MVGRDRTRCIAYADVNRDHRQSMQSVRPDETEKFATAESVAIDEAVAIPLSHKARNAMPRKRRGELGGIKVRQNLYMDRWTTAGMYRCDAVRHHAFLSLRKAYRLNGPRARADRNEAWIDKLLCLDSKTTAPSSISANRSPPKCSSELNNGLIELLGWRGRDRHFAHEVVSTELTSLTGSNLFDSI